MSLRDKLIKNSTIDLTDTLEDSKIFTKKDMIPTPVPMINVALSGSIDGGITPGLTMLAGPSKHFKTGFALLLASSFLKKYPDGIILFYDSEFGTPQDYFKTFNIPFDSVVHTPITDVEELKFDIIAQLKNIDRGERVMIIIDSIGNLASKKEVEDALNEKSVADMTRAKQLKSLFRMITPHLTLKDIPMAVINHTYKEIGMFPKDIVGGGTGSYYGSDNIWILGRRQQKKGTEVTGYEFVINVEKSRYVKEKSKIPITVTWEGGVAPYSGLLDVGLAGGYVQKPSNGWYEAIDPSTGEVLSGKKREAETLEKEFWDVVFEKTDFKEFIKKSYTIGHKSEIDMDALVDEA
jgi:RecA/RadA recombinase